MSQNNSIFEKIKVLNEINEDVKRHIKLIYVFKAYFERTDVILVTYEGKVYCFGHNWNGVLGFGHDDRIQKPIINEALFNNIAVDEQKQITDFKHSECHTIARTKDGKLYCWGSNEWGCLGNNREERKISKPKQNEYLIDEKIKDFSCGYRHTIVLTSNNEVYAWGDNDKGQIGNRSDGDVVSIPFRVNKFNKEKVKAISCGLKHSMALTENGHVFSWGHNNCGQLGLNIRKKIEKKPKRIQFESVPFIPSIGLSSFAANPSKLVSFGTQLIRSSYSKYVVNNWKQIQIEIKIEKISCGHSHSILLSTEKDIYVFGSNEYHQLGLRTKEKQMTPIKLNHSQKFIDIASHYQYDISAARSENDSYYVWGKCGKELIEEPKETQFESFDEIFAHYLQITHKTLDFYNKNKSKLNGKNMKEEALELQLNELKFKHLFTKREVIGKGSYGIVYKSSHKIEKKDYAVKKIKLKGLKEKEIKECMREIEIMSKLRNHSIVYYIKSWNGKNSVYIQMEYCYNTLKKVLEQKQSEFENKEFQTMSPFEYYISSELFKEILEGISYLHKFKPPIIHRDLNTSNILISNGTNGRFAKIADFGKATYHQYDEQTHTIDQGTVKYMPPEVKSGRKYDLKSDIYNLGFITKALFSIEIYDSTNNPIDNPFLEDKYRTICEYIENMMSARRTRRPDCKKILTNNTLWDFNINEIVNDIIRQKVTELNIRDQSIDKCFYRFFIQTKIMYWLKPIKNLQ